MFIGFLIGTICLIGLIRVLTRRGGYGGFHRYGYGYGGGPYGAWHAGAPFRAYGGPPWGRGRGLLFSTLARLDATPSQEKAILGAIDELKDAARELRGTGRETRGDVARAVSTPTFDDGAIESAATRVDEASRKMRTIVASTLAKIHGVLDDRQRKVLGDMIDSGFTAGC